MTQTKAEQWRQTILTFESAKNYENPFLDVSIWAVFEGPSGRRIKREAYWDGENRYRVAFAPTETGIWRYTLEAPEETGLSGMTGNVTCVPYEGKSAIYKHGFLKVHESGRYLTYADGTPFFWLGDTHWEFAFGERWDESNHPGMKSMFCGMADRRKEQGYNVYQTNLRSDSWNGEISRYWVENEHGDLPNVRFYQEELDRRMYYLADLGFVNALGFAWSGSIEQGIEHQKHLARYIIARYGALPMVWTLAGEVAGYLPGEPRKRAIEGWSEVAKYVEQMDGYENLQTAHYTNERPFADYCYEEPWFDFVLNQAGHGDFPINPVWYRTYRKEHAKKPFIEGEAFYEYCSTLEENGTRLCTDAMLRRVAYMSVQTGGCGYTYGAQGIWDNVWDAGEIHPLFNIFNKYGITWAKAIDGPGGAQMGYMKRFYEKQHFEEMIPYEPEAAEANISPFANKLALTTISKDRTRIIIYYGERDGSETTITGLLDGRYEISWFDPRTGIIQKADEMIETKNGTGIMPKKPGEEDWLLVAEYRE